MSTTFTPVFESKVPPYGTLGSDHPDLNRAQQRLDRLAVAGGLTPLSAFESYAPDEVEEFVDAPPGGHPPAQWFPPAVGLAAVEALRAHLTANPNTISQQAGVLEDLAEVADELRAAEQVGVRFRFAVIM
ncbi:hypothetical protein [Fimbriiglobus ruber]|uniref:Uncharacterized protein n=1 Tax=Fimbriiglobus ruber TaxID=1908690 RepID=A0A225D6K1_9BACT|nr:hypothetical protein [Fimbriiglobus ruber]OWK35274.1 hypothetical protein FRUB_09435 [Fimbriiglobus ruber]